MEAGKDRLRTPLFKTKAPTKMRPIESKKTMVATTRMGLNICHSQDMGQWCRERQPPYAHKDVERGQGSYHLELLEESKEESSTNKRDNGPQCIEDCLIRVVVVCQS